MELLFNILFLIFIIIIIKTKEYKRSLVVFLIIVTTIFYTPVIYYTLLNGTAYKKFTSVALLDYMLLSSIIFVQFILLLLWKQRIKIKKINTDYHMSNRPLMIKLYMGIIILSLVGYIALYFEYFPLVSRIIRGSSALRPDVGGTLPVYTLFSTFSLFILPSFYFYFKDYIDKHPIVKLIAIAALSVMLIIGGNKGVLIFLFIFIWAYEYKFKLNYKIFLMGIFGLLVYLLLKTGDTTSNINIFKYIATSPMRRFFVTQGSGFINRIHLFIVEYDFLNNIPIKEHVHKYIYMSTIGSAPTYFLGDLLIKYGYIISLTIHFIVIGITTIISKFIDLNFAKSLFVKWSFFSILYLLGMAEIGKAFYYRALAIVLNVLIILVIERLSQYYNNKRPGESNMLKRLTQ